MTLGAGGYNYLSGVSGVDSVDTEADIERVISLYDLGEAVEVQEEVLQSEGLVSTLPDGDRAIVFALCDLSQLHRGQEDFGILQ